MELRQQDWELIYSRILQCIDHGYGEINIKIKDNIILIKGGNTDLIEIPVHSLENPTNCVLLTNIKKTLIL
jgi:hypothetical protein